MKTFIIFLKLIFGDLDSLLIFFVCFLNIYVIDAYPRLYFALMIPTIVILAVRLVQMIREVRRRRRK